MKDLFTLAAGLALLLCIFSCNNNRHPGNENAVDSTTAQAAPLSFDSTHYVKQEGNCSQDSPCVKVSLNYPVARGGQGNTGNAINEAVHRQIVKIMEGQSEIRSDSIDVLAGDFIRQFNELNKKFPSMANQWFIEIDGRVVNTTDKIASLSIRNFSFAGGAHPNTYETYLNFDINTGQLLALTDVITDTTKVMQLAEKKFRSLHHIRAGVSLNDAGFMFDKNRFFLPSNFIAYPDSLQFLYNNYEIAAYVEGPQRITLSADELGSLYQKDKVQ